MRGCALPALAFGFALSGTSAFAGCIAVGTAYSCTGSPNETLNAGPGDNLIVSDQPVGYLTLNGQGGNDSIVFANQSELTAHSAGSVADGGDGDDLITAQDSSLLWGNILGGDGADNILVELGSFLDGTVDGGSGNDTLTVRDNDTSDLWNDNTTVTGDLSGGDGDDAIMMRDLTTVRGNIDAGNGADKITLKLGTALDGNLLAGADNDSVLIRGETVVLGFVSAGGGADLVKILEGSSIGGSVFGDDGNDSMLLDGDATVGGSTIGGDFDGGAGNDTLLSFGASTVQGNVLGGAGEDALLVSGGSTVDYSVDGGDDADLVTVQDTSLVRGDVLGGGGNDSLLVEGQATVEGALSGGAGDDLVTVTSGEVQGGIGGGDGSDTVNLSGGKIGGLAGGASMDLGAGDDTLNLTFNDTVGADALDLTGVLVFDGGTGTNAATITGFDQGSSKGGLFDRAFDGWDTITAIGSNLQFSGDATITALDLTASSALFQTNGALGLAGADGSDTATLSVDETSYVDMRDGAFAAMSTPSNGPLFVAFGPSLPSSLANDSIIVANLGLTGSADPLTLPTLRVDFDADDTAYQNGRDDAVSGNADQIDVSNSISTTGTIGIRIDAVGGYLDMGMPVGLSGSVAIIDDLQSAALSRPGVAATLVASSTYVPVSNMPVDPARQWALVDQGNGGVYLQWTTVIDQTTIGPNAGAELSVAAGGIEAMSEILSGMADRSIAKRLICVDASVKCAFAPASVWVLASNSTHDFGSANGLGGFDTSNQTLTGGVEYRLGANWSGGVFAGMQQGSTDMGSIEGAFGPRSSGADRTAGFVGGYVKAELDGAYLTALGAVGTATTDLVNGTLFNAESSHDSFVGLIGANMGKRMEVGGGLEIDPRIEASYVASNGDAYTDSEGLTVASDATQARIAATVGLSYHRAASPLTLAMRGGTAFLLSDTTASAGEAGTGPTVGVTGQSSDKVFTASVEARWMFSDTATLVGSFSADRGDDVRATRGGLQLTYNF